MSWLLDSKYEKTERKKAFIEAYYTFTGKSWHSQVAWFSRCWLPLYNSRSKMSSQVKSRTYSSKNNFKIAPDPWDKIQKSADGNPSRPPKWNGRSALENISNLPHLKSGKPEERPLLPTAAPLTPAVKRVKFAASDGYVMISPVGFGRSTKMFRESLKRPVLPSHPANNSAHHIPLEKVWFLILSCSIDSRTRVWILQVVQ